MTDKQTELKARLAAVLADLNQSGRKDTEAMWLLGGFASELATRLKAPSWSAAKARITRSTYNTLLDRFRIEGNAHYREGRAKQAYAIQALAMSLIAPTQDDAEIVAGGKQLDTIIDRALLFYRQTKASPAK